MAPELDRARPVPASRSRFLIRGSLVLAMLAVALAGGWKFWASPAPARPDPRELDRLLFTAIHNGDFRAVQDLLQRGADASARQEGGDTALMQAALHADAAMMGLLLLKGADVNAPGADGTTPLLRAVHDRGKVQLLLSQGARVQDRAVVLAALIPGSSRTIQLLVRAGGEATAEVGGFTALMGAAHNGDLESVKLLLEYGASVQATTPTGYTALVAAAQSGNAALVELLLDRGADPNARYERPNSGGDLLTPVMAAAERRAGDCLERLVQRGADVNVQGGPFDRTALVCAAITGNEPVVRLLLARGADVRAEDWEGDTALDWALRRGPTPAVELLRRAGGREAAPVPRSKKQPQLMRDIQTDSVRRALAASLPILQQSGRRITQKQACVTCHQHALLAMTIGLARRRGIAIDEAIAAEERSHVLTDLGQRVPHLLLGAGIDPLLAPYALVGLEAEDQEPGRHTDALVHYLLLRQQQDGRWRAEEYRPPEDGSDFMFTAMAVRGLDRFAPPGRRQEINRHIARARQWLVAAQPAETVDKVFRLLGLRWAGAGQAAIQAAARLLLSEQRPDGGWAQLPTLPSDAYATGQALFALHEAGGLPVEDPAYRRGVEFLLRTQLADGSWLVPSRSFPVVGFSNSGFPHSGAQFISAAGTCWATTALALTVPPTQTQQDRRPVPPGSPGRLVILPDR